MYGNYSCVYSASICFRQYFLHETTTLRVPFNLRIAVLVSSDAFSTVWGLAQTETRQVLPASTVSREELYQVEIQFSVFCSIDLAIHGISVCGQWLFWIYPTVAVIFCTVLLEAFWKSVLLKFITRRISLTWALISDRIFITRSQFKLRSITIVCYVSTGSSDIVESDAFYEKL